MLFEEAAGYYGRLEGISSRLEMINVLTEMLKKARKGEIRNIIYLTQGILAPPFSGIEIGIAEKLVEESISLATGNDKVKIEALFRKTGDLGLTAEQMAGSKRQGRMSGRKLEVNDVFEMLMKIATTSGAGSKDLKIRMLASLIGDGNPEEAKYVVRFAMGQLSLGVGDATVLEALSKMETGERKFKARARDRLQHLQRPGPGRRGPGQGRHEGHRGLQGRAVQADKARSGREAAHGGGHTREDARQVRGGEQVRRPEGAGAHRQEEREGGDILAEAGAAHRDVPGASQGRARRR